MNMSPSSTSKGECRNSRRKRVQLKNLHPSPTNGPGRSRKGSKTKSNRRNPRRRIPLNQAPKDGPRGKKTTYRPRRSTKDKSSDTDSDSPCFQYQQKGYCSKGDSCRFSHDVPHLSDESQEESNMVVLVDSSDEDGSHSSTNPVSDVSEDIEAKPILSTTVIEGSRKRAL